MFHINTNFAICILIFIGSIEGYPVDKDVVISASEDYEDELFKAIFKVPVFKIIGKHKTDGASSNFARLQTSGEEKQLDRSSPLEELDASIGDEEREENNFLIASKEVFDKLVDEPGLEHSEGQHKRLEERFKMLPFAGSAKGGHGLLHAHRSYSSSELSVVGDSIKSKIANNEPPHPMIHFVDGNYTNANETENFLVSTTHISDDNGTEHDKSVKTRKERVIEEATETKSELPPALNAFQKTVVLKQAFDCSRSLNIIMASLAVLAVIDIVTVVVVCRIRKDSHKGGVELDGRSGFKNKRNRKSNAVGNSKYFMNEDTGLYFSNARGSSSEEEAEAIGKSKSKSSASKRSEFTTKICHNNSEKEVLQKKRSPLKSSDNPCRELSRLKRNLSTRTGNVSYAGAFKRDELSPIRECKSDSLQKKITLESKNDDCGFPNATQSDDVDHGNDDFSETGINRTRVGMQLQTIRNRYIALSEDNEKEHARKSRVMMKPYNPFYDLTIELHEKRKSAYNS